MVKVFVRASALNGEALAPPSKSYTHRAVVLASLSNGLSRIENPLISEDTLATIEGCRALGASIEQRDGLLLIEGAKGLHAPSNVIDVKNSGTTLRFLTAVSSLCKEGYTVLTGDDSIRGRPMQPLLDALVALGVECWSTRLNGRAPIVVKGGGIEGGFVELPGHISSQFISALLIATPKARRRTEIKIQGKMVSRPYVEATLKTIRMFGGEVEEKDQTFLVHPKQDYRPTRFSVPGDFSSASFLLVGAALTEGRVKVKGLDFSLPQADMAIVKILDEMGADVMVDRIEGSITVKGTDELKGGELDLSDSPDLLPLVSVLALKA
ncbi:MAG: 3-phosphoshikimate 1-carboxyvinyltransferase, partial [Nitrososphaerota archaeon]